MLVWTAIWPFFCSSVNKSSASPPERTNALALIALSSARPRWESKNSRQPSQKNEWCSTGKSFRILHAFGREEIQRNESRTAGFIVVDSLSLRLRCQIVTAADSEASTSRKASVTLSWPQAFKKRIYEARFEIDFVLKPGIVIQYKIQVIFLN